MPIYAYRCSNCGHEKEVLQKMSDAQLTTCPECHSETFCKQLTAAGFQLKGSGWYATDFKGGTSAQKTESKTEAPVSVSKTESKTEAPASASKSEPKTATTTSPGGNGSCASQ